MKWWSMKGQGVIFTPSLPPLSFSKNPFLWILVSEAVDNPLSMPPCSLQRERISTQCEEGGIHLGSEENNFFPHHPHFTVQEKWLWSRKPQFLQQLLSLINCQYVRQNYHNILASFSIFSRISVSLFSSRMFPSKFPTSLWTWDFSVARVDFSSLK